MARALLVVGILASIVFGWHLYAASDVRRHAEDLRAKHGAGSGRDPVRLNPVTDIVTVPIGPPTAKSNDANPFDALGKALGSIVGGALGKALEPSFERELNLRARELFDVYAMLIPYRVEIPAPETGEPT
jgi:hypothetical protein